MAVRNPKTAWRGARQQYTRIEGAAEVRYLEATFGHMDPHAALLDLSTRLFRKRWDALTSAFGLHRNTFTPGGMRGGGAVSFFRASRDIALLMWQMRVKGQSTLAHYLQETSTQTSLLDLSPEVCNRVRSAALMYEHVLNYAFGTPFACTTP